MRCAVWTRVGQVEIQEWPIPEIREDEVLIKVAYTGICASDVHILKGGLPASAIAPPRILGHEFSGTIERIGAGVRGLRVGLSVVAHPNGPCGECFNCRHGEEHYCTAMYSIIRGPGQGSFAEFTTVKAKQVYPLPMSISLEDGALVEPAAIAVHCSTRAELVPGDHVLVIGAGTIGLLVTQMARLTGASQVIVSEPIAWKRQLARQLGADETIDPASEDLAARAKELTAGAGVDVCIEAVGSPRAFEQAIDTVRERGRIILVGWPPMDSTSAIPPFKIYRKELEVRGSFFSPYSFQRAIAMLPRLNVSALRTHVLSLGEIGRALGLLQEGQAVKVLLKP
jgi:L-iditol 2-dehydrogenase